MQHHYIWPGIAVLFFACSGLRLSQVKGNELTGFIYLVKGNQMPSPGKPMNKGRGVSRDIYAYEPTNFNNATGNSPLFISIRTRLIAHTKSDSTGHYILKLPAGKYSIFIKDGTNFFAGESDGNGVLSPVDIINNTSVKKDFTITAGAAY